MKQSTERLLLSKKIERFFRGFDEIPADRMDVDVVAQPKPSVAIATIRYVVNCCGIKEHTVRVHVDFSGGKIKHWHYVNN